MIKLHPDTIADCCFDYYVNPDGYSKLELIKIITDLVNGDLDRDCFVDDIESWINDRKDEGFYLGNNGRIEKE